MHEDRYRFIRWRKGLGRPQRRITGSQGRCISAANISSLTLCYPAWHSVSGCMHEYACHRHLQVITVTSNLACGSTVTSFKRIAQNPAALPDSCAVTASKLAWINVSDRKYQRNALEAGGDETVNVLGDGFVVTSVGVVSIHYSAEGGDN